MNDSTRPRVLFVSKPIVPPWHDGSKNLVRDLATSLVQHAPTVMTTPGAQPLRREHAPDGAEASPPGASSAIDSWPLYESSGRFSPGLEANARVLAALASARDFAIWHFVFAPNMASSTAARFAMVPGRLRGVRRVVQTVASRPKRFERAPALVFGDVVVALSEWTRARFLASGVDGRRLAVIPPCARPLRVPSAEERKNVRIAHNLGDGPVVLYPGDLEVSTGAQTMARAADRIVRAIPEARVVFACRKKTAHATHAESRLKDELATRGLSEKTRFVGEVSDMAPLLHESAVLALPADDLYGKVDVPLVVIEALAAGIPLVLARGGPLESVTSARFVEPEDDASLATAIRALLHDVAIRSTVAEEGRALYARAFRPEVVAARYEELYAR